MQHESINCWDPQTISSPDLVIAALAFALANTAITFTAVDGMVVWPALLSPHAMTVPAWVSAKVCAVPTAICAIFVVALLGTVAWFAVFLPHATTPPLAVSPTLNPSPAPS
jgi:hypothetical protein